MDNNNANEVYKPLSIARDDLMRELVKAANDSKLPLVVMEYVARDFYEEVKATASMQYEKDKEDYEKELAKQKKSESDNKVK